MPEAVGRSLLEAVERSLLEAVERSLLETVGRSLLEAVAMGRGVDDFRWASVEVESIKGSLEKEDLEGKMRLSGQRLEHAGGPLPEGVATRLEADLWEASGECHSFCVWTGSASSTMSMSMGGT